MLKGLRRLLHRLLRRGRAGAHAIALTPDRQIILVKLRYARGWYLPGGGRHDGESVHDAALRELREELGMAGHGRVRLATELGNARNLHDVLVVEDVRYSLPRWSWEVQEVREELLDSLPAQLSPLARSWIAAVRDKL